MFYSHQLEFLPRLAQHPGISPGQSLSSSLQGTWKRQGDTIPTVEGHQTCQADNTLHLTPVLWTLTHENSHRTRLLRPHGPLLRQTQAGPLVFSAKHQTTSQACQLAHSHKPGRSSAPSVTPLLPKYSSADKRHARIPSDQPSVEDKLRSEL